MFPSRNVPCCKHNFWLAYSWGNLMVVIQNLNGWPPRLPNLMEGQRLISGDQTKPGVRLKSTCLDLVVSFNFSAVNSVMFCSGTKLPLGLMSFTDCYLQARSICQPTWHRSPLFAKLPLYQAFFVLIVSFKGVLSNSTALIFIPT